MLTAALVILLLAAPEGERIDFGTSTARRVKLLRHANPGVRRKAALLLGHAEPDAAIAALLVALSDPAAGVRAAAANSLQRMADERAVPFLAARLRTERVARVSAELLLALARCGGPYIARHVQPFLEHPSRPVRAAAAAALGHIGDAGQRDALWAALRYAPDDPGFVVRAAVLTAFVNLGWREDVRRALDEMEKAGALRHWASRAAMLSAVGAARIDERLDWVRREVGNTEDPRLVAAAAGALARLGYRDEVFALVDHDSPMVRRAALVALQESGDPRAVTRALEMVKSDADRNVRFEAALVLYHADHPDADLYLIDALKSRNPLFWMSALSALEKKHDRSFGRDPEKWTAFLKESGSRSRIR